MKRLLILIVSVAAAFSVTAQDPEFVFTPERHLPKYQFTLPDSLSHMIPWESQFKESMRPGATAAEPTAAESPIVVLQGYKVPKGAFVNSHNVLQMPHLTISNGQAWNWGPFLDSFLDARTIIMPMPM